MLRIITQICLFGILASGFICSAGKVYYKDNLENKEKIKFRAIAFPWISSLSAAERINAINIHHTSYREAPDGRTSFAIDATVNKAKSQWGARAMWTTVEPMQPIKLNNPVYFFAKAFSEQLPPDTELRFGIIFNAVNAQNGKTVKGGCHDIKHIRVDGDGWLIFDFNITEYLTKRNYKDIILTGWQFTIFSQKDFYGQRVKAEFCDVTITDSRHTNKDGVNVKKEDKLTGDHSNLISGNASFETGNDGWNVIVDDKCEAPDGVNAAKIPAGERSLWSKAYHNILKPHTEYNFSFYAKVANPILLRVSVHGTSHEFLSQERFSISENWQRYSLVVDENAVNKIRRHFSSKSNQLEEFGAKFLFSKSPGDINTPVWIDGIQLTAGKKLYPFRSRDDISAEIHLPSNKKGILTSQNKSIDFVYNIYNKTDVGTPLDAKFVVKDYWGNEFFSKNTEISLSNSKLTSDKISVNITQNGFFEVSLQLYRNNKSLYRTSRNFVKIPPPVKSKEKFMGLHPILFLNHDPDALQMMGVKAVRLFFHSKFIKYVDEKSEFPDSWKLKPFADRDMLIMVCSQYDWKKIAEVNFACQLKKYEKHWQDIVTNFSAYTNFWEIENEPNLTMPEKLGVPNSKAADYYVEAVNQATQAIKKIQPNAIFSTGISSGKRDDYLWFKKVLANGKSPLDVISNHPYADQRMICDLEWDMGPEQVKSKQTSQEILKIITQSGGKQKIATGEIGWGLDAKIPALSEPGRRHARYMARVILQSKVWGAERVFYFIEEGVYEKLGFEYGLWLSDMQPRLAVAAYSTLGQMLEDSVYEQPLVETDELFAYLFSKNNIPFIAMWRIEKSAESALQIPLESNKLKLINIMNNVVPLSPQGNATRIALSYDPVFLFPANNKVIPEFRQALNDLKWDIAPVKINTYTDSRTKISFRLTNNYRKPQSGKLLALIDGTRYSKNVQLSPAGITDVVIQLSALLKDNSEVEYRFESSEGNVTGKQKFEFYPVAYKTIDPSMDFYSNIKGIRPIVVNDRLSVLPPDPFIDWKGPDDLSIKTYLCWDEINFYFMAEVTDNIHHNQQNKGRLWMSDSIQLAFDTKADAQHNAFEYDRNDFELTLALSNHKSLWNFNNGGGRTKREQNPQVSVVRNKDKTLYQAKIPWKRLKLDGKVNSVFGFNFMANEDEGNGRFHYMGLTPGIGDQKYPFQYKKFCLSK